jgi:hypothetical protein
VDYRDASRRCCCEGGEMSNEDEIKAYLVIQALRQALAKTETISIDWKKVWEELDNTHWKIRIQFEKDMRKKHGPHEGLGEYHMNDESLWEYEKKFIQRLVKKYSTIKRLVRRKNT